MTDKSRNKIYSVCTGSSKHKHVLKQVINPIFDMGGSELFVGVFTMCGRFLTQAPFVQVLEKENDITCSCCVRRINDDKIYHGGTYEPCCDNCNYEQRVKSGDTCHNVAVNQEIGKLILLLPEYIFRGGENYYKNISKYDGEWDISYSTVEDVVRTSKAVDDVCLLACLRHMRRVLIGSKDIAENYDNIREPGAD
jgi:hypothetical protein